MSTVAASLSSAPRRSITLRPRSRSGHSESACIAEQLQETLPFFHELGEQLLMPQKIRAGNNEAAYILPLFRSVSRLSPISPLAVEKVR